MGIGNIATSGMDAAMSDMEVISNNIANANTTGFKKSYADFADIYPATGGAQPGLGVQLSGIRQDFTEGGIEATDRQLDMSIGNSSFFVMKDPNSGITTYTRAGRFLEDNNGFVNNGSQRVQMFPAVDGVILPSANLTDMQIPNNTNPASPTANAGININLNFSATTPISTFNPTDTTSYNYRTDQTIYDSLGNSYQLSMFYIKSASPANTWTAQTQVNGTSIGTGTLTFDSTGNLSTSTGLSALSFTPEAGAASPQALNVSMTGTTQVAGSSANRTLTQDGFAAGQRTGFNVDPSGNVTVSYSNGQSALIGQIALATFSSPENLQYNGAQSWVATTSAGTPNVSPSNSSNAISGDSLESSNVNLTEEMVNLLDAQHNFQANAQVEQTYNEIMQTIIKL